MKTIAVIFASVAVTAAGYAQNTYPWPASGNVGIGTTAPNQQLSVNGNLSVGSTGSFIMMGQSAYTGGGGYIFLKSTGDYGRDFNIQNYSSVAGWKTNLFVAGESGNIGIGTTNPEARFHVQSYPSIGLLADGIRISRPNSPNCYAFTSYGGGASGESGDTAFFGSVYAGGTKGRITFRVSDGASHLDAATIDPAGNVGIGTAYPRSRFDIGSELGAGKGARFGDYLELNEREYYNNASSIGWNAYIAANDGTYQPLHAPGSGMVLAMEGGGIGNLDFWGRNWAGSSTPVHLSAFTHVMRLSVNGNVGIGTTSPSEKLSVKGKIRAQEVIVETTGWSDHVFADSYKLQSLAEVEQHIKTEKHLPGVPSAREVAAKGVSLGDMQAILLAKIEELTLHQIALDKLVKAQAAEIAELKSKTGQ